MQNTFERWYYENPRLTAVLFGVAFAVVAVVIGGLLGFAGPIITVAIVVGLVGAIIALTSLELGLWGIVGVICLVPFATLPVKIVITPTFLNLAMAAMLGVYALQWMTARRQTLATTPAHLPIMAYAVLAVVTFVFGMDNGPLTSTLLRRFAEFILTIGFGLVIVDIIRTPSQLRTLLQVIMLGGAAAAAIGIGLWLLPDELANRLLTALEPVGYPGGFVLRYIEDTPELGERAIGTSVDPNSFGGLLAIMGALAAPQLVAKEPLFGRRWLSISILGIVLLALFLTFSRGAMLALVMAIGFIAVMRYRRLLVWMAAGGLLTLVLPITQGYVARFVEGFQGEDLATQMRFGEYQDALTLIERYPVFGVGFAGAPDIDIYLGVSNAYLNIAQKMGMVGLALFLFALGVVFLYGFLNRKAVYVQPDLVPAWLGVHAGLVSVLVVGIFDHYFVNLEFQPAQTLLWLLVGLCLATTRMAIHRNSTTSAQLAK